MKRPTSRLGRHSLSSEPTRNHRLRQTSLVNQQNLNACKRVRFSVEALLEKVQLLRGLLVPTLHADILGYAVRNVSVV